MKKEILLVVDAVSNEKGVDRGVIFEALEAALASATRKKHGDSIGVRVAVDRETGNFDTFRQWQVIADDAELESANAQIKLTEAREQDPELEVGDFIEEPMESVEFGRISAQAAKQVIVQKVREAERAQVIEAYKPRIGQLVSGLVKRIERGALILDLGGNAEAIVPRDHLIPREPVKPGDRIRGLLLEVRLELRGPQLLVSRNSARFLVELFKLEVPEVGQGLIEIKGAARDPGLRAKIAVQAKDKRIDPVGACVGMRGARVQSVSNELAGERIDIVLWDENPAQFVINAMAPADVDSIMVDEDAHAMQIAVSEEKLGRAIGVGGQNIRLASELTGWTLNVMTAAEAESRNQVEAGKVKQSFVDQLGVDEEVAAVLVQEGFTTVEEVAYVPESEMQAIEGFDEEIVHELKNRARDALLTKAIATAEHAEDTNPSQDLLTLTGMDEALAEKLAAGGVRTRDALADLATDELVELAGMEETRASELIMAARAHWYQNK